MTIREARDILQAERNRVVGKYGEIPEGYTVFLPQRLYAQGDALDLCGFTVHPTEDEQLRFWYEGPDTFRL